jgi:hypothetical protein
MDEKGIMHHEFGPEGQTVTGSFCLSVLEHLWKRICHVRPEYSAPGSWFLLHDNALVHQAVAVQEFLARKQVCVLNCCRRNTQALSSLLTFEDGTFVPFGDIGDFHSALWHLVVGS